MLFVHLNPITGIVEPYTDKVQALLRASAVPSEHFLGNLCLQATVHLCTDGNHFQTTPRVRVGRSYKREGYREVRSVATGDTACYVTETLNGWRFSSGNDGSPVRIVMPRRRVPVWQWCTTRNISTNEVDWVAYAAAVDEKLENLCHTALSELRGQFELAVDVGVTRKIIEVDLARMYYIQRDAQTGATRWVRRILVEQDDLERERAEREAACPTDDVCAICLASFVETCDLPRTTLPCSHVFHAACLAPCVDARCPLCRASWA